MDVITKESQNTINFLNLLETKLGVLTKLKNSDSRSIIKSLTKDDKEVIENFLLGGGNPISNKI